MAPLYAWSDWKVNRVFKFNLNVYDSFAFNGFRVTVLVVREPLLGKAQYYELCLEYE